MNIPIKSKNEILNPPVGYVFPFIDKEDMQLKAKLSDGLIVNYTNVNEELKPISLADYSAFEVVAHDKDIQSGYSELLGGNVAKTIAAGMEHRFILRSTIKELKESDIVIDWGDGSSSVLSKDEVMNFSYDAEENESTTTVRHIYSKAGKYIIKIFGKNYFGYSSWQGANSNEHKQYNLMCRIFDSDLPTASHLTNMSSAASFAQRLLKVNIPSYYKFPCVENSSYLFYASAVTEVVGLKNRFWNVATNSNIFDSCTQLENTDFMFPALTARGTYRKSFTKCYKLKTPVSKMFFAGGIVTGKIDVSQLFDECSSLPAEDLSEYFWNNDKVEWINTSKAFTKCSDELRAKVPASWGGTADDSIIKPSLKKRIEALEMEMGNTLALDK